MDVLSEVLKVVKLQGDLLSARPPRMMITGQVCIAELLVMSVSERF